MRAMTLFLGCRLPGVLRQLTIAGLAPVTRLIIERNKSNRVLRFFKRVRTELGISRAF